MPGDVKVAVVHGALNGLSGISDFTEPGFGMPKACIIIVSLSRFDTTIEDDSRVSIGFSDFTNNYCISHQDEHAQTKVDCDSIKSNTKSYILLTISAGISTEGTASAITDGVRLTNSVDGLAHKVTIIMFGGADLQISLDSVSTPNSIDGTVDTVTNIDQDLVFFIGVDVSGEDSARSGTVSSFGISHIDTSDHLTFVNRCIGWSSNHAANDGEPYARLQTDACLAMINESGGEDWGMELTAATSSQYTITERDVKSGAGMEFYALALDLDTNKSKIGSVDGPTSGTTWVPSVSLGFIPQYVGLALTDLTSDETVIDGTDEAGSIGISSNTGVGHESCHSWYNEDASATTNTANLFSSNVIDLYDDVTTTQLQDHSHLSFDSGGWTYTINTENEDAGPKKWFYWSIETNVKPSETLSNLSDGILGIQNSYAGPFEI